MMEVEFQRNICNAARAEGGYAHKRSNRFMVGIVDLLIKMPAAPAAIIECKMVTIPKQHNTVIHIDMTKLQRADLKEFRRAGGWSGYMLCAPAPKLRDKYYIYMGSALDQENLGISDFIDCSIIKHRGEAWPIKRLWERLEMQMSAAF